MITNGSSFVICKAFSSNKQEKCIQGKLISSIRHWKFNIYLMHPISNICAIISTLSHKFKAAVAHHHGPYLWWLPLSIEASLSDVLHLTSSLTHFSVLIVSELSTFSQHYSFSRSLKCGNFCIGHGRQPIHYIKALSFAHGSTFLSCQIPKYSNTVFMVISFELSFNLSHREIERYHPWPK